MRKLIIILIGLIGLATVEAKNTKIAVNLEEVETSLAQLEADLASLDIELAYLAEMDSQDSESLLVYVGETQSKNNKSSSLSSKDIFDKLTNTKGIEVVFISKAMLGMMPKMSMPGVDISNIVGKLESLQILSAESNPASNILKMEVDRLVQSKEYETLMYVKDDESRTGFFVKKDKNSDNTEMLMVTEDNGEVTLIRFFGNFKLKDIQDIAKKQSKKKK